MNSPDTHDDLSISSPRVVRYEFQNAQLPGFDLKGLRDELSVDWSEYEAESEKFDTLDQRVLEAVFAEAIEVKSWKDPKAVGNFLLATEDKVAAILDGVEGVETFYYKLTQKDWSIYQIDESTIYDLRDVTVTCMQYYIWKLFRKRAQERLEKLPSVEDPAVSAKNEMDFVCENLFGVRLEAHFVGPVFKDVEPQTVNYSFEGIAKRIYTTKRAAYEPDYCRPESIFVSSSKLHKHLDEVVSLIDFHLCLPRTTYYELVIQDQLIQNGFYEEWKAWIRARGDLLCNPESETAKAFREFWGENLPPELDKALQAQFKKNKAAIERFQGLVSTRVEGSIVEEDEEGRADHEIEEETLAMGETETAEKKEVILIELSSDFDEKLLGVDGTLSIPIEVTCSDHSALLEAHVGVSSRRKKAARFRQLTSSSQHIAIGRSDILIPEFERDADTVYRLEIQVKVGSGEESKSLTFQFATPREKRPTDHVVVISPVVQNRVTEVVNTVVSEPEEEVSDPVEPTTSQISEADIQEAIQLLLDEESRMPLQIVSHTDAMLEVAFDFERLCEVLEMDRSQMSEMVGESRLSELTCWHLRFSNGRVQRTDDIPDQVIAFAQMHLDERQQEEIRSFVASVSPELAGYGVDDPALVGTGGWNPAGSKAETDTLIGAFCERIKSENKYRCYISGRDKDGYLSAFTLASREDPKWSIILRFDRKKDQVTYDFTDAGVDRGYLTGVANAMVNFLVSTFGNVPVGHDQGGINSESAAERARLRGNYQHDLNTGNARFIVGDAHLLEETVEPVIIKGVSARNFERKLREAREKYPGQRVYLLYRRNTFEFQDSMERGVVRMRDETVEAVYDRLEESEALRHILLERCHATLFNGTARYKDRTAFISGSRVFDALFETVSQVFGAQHTPNPDEIDDAFVSKFLVQLRQELVPVIYISSSYASPQEHRFMVEKQKGEI